MRRLPSLRIATSSTTATTEPATVRATAAATSTEAKPTITTAAIRTVAAERTSSL